MDYGNAGGNFSASVNLPGVEPASPSRHHTNQPNWTIRAINHREGLGALEYWPSLSFDRWTQLLLCYIPAVLWSWQWFSSWLSSPCQSSRYTACPFSFHQRTNHAPSPTILQLLAQLDKMPIRVGPLVFEFCGVNQAPTNKINSILQRWYAQSG
jgi:hypothetical protein